MARPYDRKRNLQGLVKNQGLPAFSDLVKACAGVLAAGALSFGGYEAVQARRAALWEGDLTFVGRLVEGAGAIGAREMDILVQRDASSKKALASLSGLEEPMEFLVGKAVPDLAERRAAMAASDRRSIENAVSLRARIDKAMEMRKAGMGSSDFIEAAREALGGEARSVGINQPFAGPAGFASKNLASLEASMADDAREAPIRLAKAKTRLTELAPGFDEGRGEIVSQRRAAEAGAEARQLALAEATAQIEGYRKLVRQSAQSAFQSEGESMGEGDWEEINADLERDSDWIGAKAGLIGAADASALSARGLAQENWNAEMEHAHEIAAAIALDKSSVDQLRVWEVAMMLQWLDTPGPSASAIVAIPPSRMAAQGYSLAGAPKAGLDGASSYRIIQSQPAQVSPRYASSNLSVVLAHGLAVRSGDQAAAAGLAAKAASARVSLIEASKNVIQNKAVSYAGLALNAPGAPAPTWSLGASLAAQRAAMAASAKAAGSAAQGAANKAAQSAANKAAQSASNKAAATASTRSSSNSNSGKR